MKKILTIIICSLFILPINAQEIKINSEKSIVEFNYVAEDAIGTINGIEGKINFDISNLSASSLASTIPSVVS